MLKKLLTGAAAIVFAAGVAGAANLSILSGSQYSEPSQVLATVNTLIQNINTGVSGRLGAGLTASPTAIATTAEQTMYSYSLPASQLTNAGDAVRVVCWGTSATNSNAKTAKLYFGNSVITTASSQVTAAQFSNVGWKLEMLVLRSGSATQNVLASGAISTTPVGVYTNSGTDSLAAAVTIKCTGITPTAAQDLTAQGMLVEQVK